MKFIVAIIQPHRLDTVHDALTDAGVTGMTVSEVKGYGRQKGQTEIYRGAEYEVSYTPKVKIEVAIDDQALNRVMEVITSSAKTGRIGDGKVFVYDLVRAVRIRTGETGSNAL